jgi:hypothetical protein
MGSRDKPAQRRMPLARDERLRLIDGVDPAAAGMGRRQWRNVHALLKTLEYCSTGGDSQVRVEVLMAKMNVDRRTVQRARAAAEAAGLLDVEHRVWRNGQTSNEWRLNWGRVAALQLAQIRAHQLPPMGGELPPPRGKLPPPRGKLPPPLIENSALYCSLETIHNWSTPTRAREPGVRSPGDDQKFSFGAGTTRGVATAELDAATIRGIAERVERQSRGDWDLACKAAALVAMLGEQWLWDAVEGVMRKRPPARNPWSYLHRCLDEGAQSRGVKFARALSLVELPAELVADDGREARAMRERLCTPREE